MCVHVLRIQSICISRSSVETIPICYIITLLWWKSIVCKNSCITFQSIVKCLTNSPSNVLILWNIFTILTFCIIFISAGRKYRFLSIYLAIYVSFIWTCIYQARQQRRQSSSPRRLWRIILTTCCPRSSSIIWWVHWNHEVSYKS